MGPLALLIGLLAPPPDSGEVRALVDPPDATIRLDGALIAPARPVWVKAGAHTLEVSAPGRVDQRQAFVLDAGGRARFDVRLLPAAPAPAQRRAIPAARPGAAPRPAAPWVLPGQAAGVITGTPRAARSSGALRWVGNSAFIAAVLTGMAAGIVGIVMQVKASRFRDERSYARKVELRGDAQDLAFAGNVLLGITGALAATGFVLYGIDSATDGPQPVRVRTGLVGFRGAF